VRPSDGYLSRRHAEHRPGARPDPFTPILPTARPGTPLSPPLMFVARYAGSTDWRTVSTASVSTMTAIRSSASIRVPGSGIVSDSSARPWA